MKKEIINNEVYYLFPRKLFYILIIWIFCCTNFLFFNSLRKNELKKEILENTVFYENQIKEINDSITELKLEMEKLKNEK